MVEALLPVSYFGSIDYFILLSSYERVVIESCESYPKQTLRNRCRIYSANGPLDLVVPVKHSGNKLITSIEPDYSVSWQKQHWHALVAAYKRSPFFDYYADDLKPFFNEEHHNLFSLDMEISKQLCLLLGIKTQFSYTSDFKPYHTEYDYRNLFKPSKHPQLFQQEHYYQVFSEKTGFLPNMSILDLLFNEGPAAAAWLRNQSVEKKVFSL